MGRRGEEGLLGYAKGIPWMEHRWFPSEDFLEVQNGVGVSTVPDSISCIETSCLKVRCHIILYSDTGPCPGAGDCLRKGPIKMITGYEKAFWKFRLLPLGHVFSSFLIPGGAGGGNVSLWHLRDRIKFAGLCFR